MSFLTHTNSTVEQKGVVETRPAYDVSTATIAHNYLIQRASSMNSPKDRAKYYDELMEKVYNERINDRLTINMDDFDKFSDVYTFGTDLALVKAAFTYLPRFPCPDQSATLLKSDPEMMVYSKKRVALLAKKIRGYTLSEIHFLSTQPISCSRQKGPSFSTFLDKTFTGEVLLEDDFIKAFNSGDIDVYARLSGHDAVLKSFLKKYFDYIDDKGIDAIILAGGTIFVIEAKYTVGEGGGQNHQSKDAANVHTRFKHPRIKSMAVIDGDIWKKIYDGLNLKSKKKGPSGYITAAIKGQAVLSTFDIENFFADYKDTKKMEK